MKFQKLIRKVVYFFLKLYNNNGGGIVIKRPEGNILKASSSFYNFRMNDINGNEIDFITFKGRKILVVNTASACGYTAQYAHLEKLFKQYKNKLWVLGFPSNDFGKQEPGTNEEIKQFCNSHYQVTFPLFEKISVIGPHQHPLYSWLSETSLNGWNDIAPGWNFCKYLVDEKGELIYFYSEKISPLSKEIINQIKIVR